MMSQEKRKVLREVLSDRCTPEQMQAYTELEAVEREMKKQWDSGKTEPVDWKLKRKIWTKVVRGCSLRKDMKFRFAPVWGAAAAVVFIVCGIWFLLDRKHNEDKYIRISALENQEYVLPDSSRVWMQAGSSIRYARDFVQDRKVWQEGNTLFEVYKHPGSVFQVYIAHAFIEVRGTCFEVRQVDSVRSMVSLFRGAVDFHTDGRETAMLPMQKLLYNAQDMKVEKIEGLDHINWEGDRFVFTNIRLADLIDFMNRFYDTRILIGENVNESDDFTGGIRYTESCDEVLKKLCYVVNLKIREQDGELIIYK